MSECVCVSVCVCECVSVCVSECEWGFPGGAGVKNLPSCAGDARDTGSIPGSGRSPGGGNGSPLQYSCLGNPMNSGAWRAAAQGLTELNRTERALRIICMYL